MKDGKPIGFVIRTLSRMIGRRADSSAGRQYLDSLTGTNGWIIGYLAHNQGRDIYQKDIEEHFSVRRSTVSRVVTLMEQKGLVVRENVDSDARLKRLVLTNKALEIHKSIESSLDEVENVIADGISEEDMEIFLRVAHKMMDNLNDGECPGKCHEHMRHRPHSGGGRK
ncbi:MAG: winged helix-turn-helix transcriptional regulator [Clostridia bacterium]|nr:winged helix-turn-helix transcriptional regulator [Clostridia bacterium]